MLSEEERKEIEAEAGQYDRKEAGSVEALKVVQRHRGWVSDEAIRDISAALDMTPDELDAVATFYSFIFRREVGRNLILVCDSVACYVMGYQGVLDSIKEKLGIDLGGTTEDRRFTLLPISCLGQCDKAPAIMINEDIYGNLGPEMLDSILSRYK